MPKQSSTQPSKLPPLGRLSLCLPSHSIWANLASARQQSLFDLSFHFLSLRRGGPLCPPDNSRFISHRPVLISPRRGGTLGRPVSCFVSFAPSVRLRRPPPLKGRLDSPQFSENYLQRLTWSFPPHSPAGQFAHKAKGLPTTVPLGLASGRAYV